MDAGVASYANSVQGEPPQQAIRVRTIVIGAGESHGPRIAADPG